MKLFEQNNFFLIIAGFIWGLSGFTVEIISGDALQQQLIFRLVLILISSSIIYIFLPFKLKKEHLLTILLLLFYLIGFVVSTIINNASISNIFREVILFYSCTTILVIFSSGNLNLKKFITGVYYALILLSIYYFINIDFSKFFSLLYRFRTNLNPNGISLMAVMLFSISLTKYYSSKKDNVSFIHLILSIMSVIIILATRSRTALAMLLVAFILLNILYKKKRTLFVTFIFTTILIVYNLNSFETLIRLSTPADYSGQKTITNLTGRTDIWKHGLKIIYNNFFFGIGADKAFVKIDGHWGSFHNAYIQIIIASGILSFLPILLIVSLALKRVLLFKDEYLIIIIFLTGFLGSFVENRLLNFGSPGNLLFLISLLYLSRISFKIDSSKYNGLGLNK